MSRRMDGWNGPSRGRMPLTIPSLNRLSGAGEGISYLESVGFSFKSKHPAYVELVRITVNLSFLSCKCLIK